MTLGDRPFRRSGWDREDHGAAAIEFALVFPLFVMLTFGMISAGFAFFYDIQLTQAARDAARFGSTFPLESPGTECGQPSASSCTRPGLEQVAAIAAKQTGWAGTAAGDLTDNGSICVAYFGGAEDVALFYDSTGGPVDQSMPCVAVDEGDPQNPQVQVVIERDSEINAVLFSWDVRLRTQSVIPWERRDAVVTTP